MLKKYSKFGSDVICLEDALVSLLGAKYHGKTWGLSGDGLHDRARNSNSGIVWRNWLVGPLGHQFIADAVSMLLLKALRLMDSITEADLNLLTQTDIPAKKQPLCFSSHSPSYGNNNKGIELVQIGNWKFLPGSSTNDDEIPANEASNPACQHKDTCGYYDGRGSSSKSLEFNIAGDQTLPNRRVYVCCCCNFDLCVSEQFQDYVQFNWETPLAIDLKDFVDDNPIAGKECRLIAASMPFANKLSISINTPQASLPVKISKIIVG